MANLYPYLILVGLSFIVATLWLLFQARARVEITNELVQLNQSLQFDLPNFLRACWFPLQKAGFKGVAWRLDWFGSTITMNDGIQEGVELNRTLEVQDITLNITLYDGKRRFEQRYFSTMLSESFFLLLYTDMWVKLGSVQGAFAQTAKMSVFLQHDMKNIVQLVSLMTEQLEHTPVGSEAKLIASLKTVMPTLRDRSERFLDNLSSEEVEQPQSSLELTEALEKSAEIHDLAISVSGRGQATISSRSLDSVFDNIFGNYVDQNRRDPASAASIKVDIHEKESVLTVSIYDENGEPCIWPERLFEPFWSEKGDGLGIGLYHARQLVSGAGGDLQALAPVDQPLKFVLSLPR